MAVEIPMFVPTYSFSIESYQKMADLGIIKPDVRVELIEGKIITRSAMRSPHAACVRRLADILRTLLGQNVMISEEKAISLGNNSAPEPDIAVVKFRDDYYEDRHPQPEDIFLLVEVSLTTQKYDRDVKIPLYASFNIPEVWIVDLEEQVIEVYEQPKGKEYRSKKIYGINEALQSSLVKQLAVNKIIKPK